jgi:hypothetical protein
MVKKYLHNKKMYSFSRTAITNGRIYHIIVLEVKNLKSVCYKGRAPSEGSEGESPLSPLQLLVVAGNS